nr:hypothetical protein [Desulfobulbaceae bacterium]
MPLKAEGIDVDGVVIIAWFYSETNDRFNDEFALADAGFTRKLITNLKLLAVQIVVVDR